MQKKNVLVIDDEPINHFIMSKMAESVQWVNQVYYCENGVEAMIFLKKYFVKQLAIPEIILLDLHMPLMDGITFLRQLKKWEAFYTCVNQVLIAVVSSSLDPQEHRQVFELGVRQVIPKPMTIEKLNLLIEKEPA